MILSIQGSNVVGQDTLHWSASFHPDVQMDTGKLNALSTNTPGHLVYTTETGDRDCPDKPLGSNTDFNWMPCQAPNGHKSFVSSPDNAPLSGD